MNILAFTNSTSSRYWRFDGQARYLNANGNEMFVTHADNWNEKWVGADLVVMQMVSNPKMVDFVHSHGGKVIFEADDLIDAETKRVNIDMKEETVREFNETIKRCDGVTVTTKYLASVYGELNSKVYVLPNYLDLGWWGESEKRPERIDKTIRIGWAGGRTHDEDLRMVTPVLKRLLEKFDFLRFVYCGYGGMSSERLLTEVGWGKDVFEEIPRGRREFYIGVSPEYWPAKLRTLDFDIGIAPLINDHFNRCKSNIKFIEYSREKIPAVYSKVVYGDTVNPGVNGFLAATENEWEHYLEKLILNENIRKDFSQRAFDEVEQKWLLKDHWQEWESVYKEVINGRTSC